MTTKYVHCDSAGGTGTVRRRYFPISSRPYHVSSFPTWTRLLFPSLFWTYLKTFSFRTFGPSLLFYTSVLFDYVHPLLPQLVLYFTAVHKILAYSSTTLYCTTLSLLSLRRPLSPSPTQDTSVAATGLNKTRVKHHSLWMDPGPWTYWSQHSSVVVVLPVKRRR